MVIITGILTNIWNANSLTINSNNEDYYISTVSSIGTLQIGSTFSVEIIEREACYSYKKNEDGLYKLIQKQQYLVGTVPIVFYNFKQNETNEIISVESNYLLNLNDNILGDNYDLDLLHNYKGLEVLPNLIENKTRNLQEVLIGNLMPTIGYNCTLNNGMKINITSAFIKPSDIGFTKLVEIQHKYLGLNIVKGNSLIPYYNTNLKFSQNLISTLGEFNCYNMYTLNGNQYVVCSNNIITDNNSNKLININQVPLFSMINIKKSLTGSYKLNQILVILGINFYIFSTEENDIFATLSQPNLLLDESLGELFNFDISKIYYAEKLFFTTQDDPLGCVYKGLLDPIYLFGSEANALGEEEKTPSLINVLLGPNNIPTPQDTGKKFRLNLKEVLLGLQIKDVFL